MKKYLEKLEKFVFYVLVFSVPWQLRHIFFVWGNGFNEWQGIYLYATDILVLVLLVLWAWRSRKLLKPDNSEKALLVFLFFSALSLFAAQNFWLGFYSFGKLLEFAFLFLYLKRNFPKIFDAQRFWLVFGAGAVLQSLIAIAQFLKQGSLGLKFLTESPLAPDLAGAAKIVLDNEKMIRAYGLTPHPNILAAILAAAIFGMGYLFLRNYRLFVIPAPHQVRGKLEAGIHPAVAGRVKPGMTEKKRLALFILVLFFLIFALFLTFSRAILVLEFFFFLLWLIFLWRISELKKPLKILFGIFVICYMFFVVCFWPFLSVRFSDLKTGEQAVDLRLFLNEAGLDILKQNPILGAGQGNFVFTLSQKFPDLPAWQFQPVHNIYLLIAAETGLLGLLAFLAFLFLTLKSAWQKRNDLFVFSLLFLLYCLLLIGLTDHFLWDLQQGQLLFWMFLGIFVSVGHSERRSA